MDAESEMRAHIGDAVHGHLALRRARVVIAASRCSFDVRRKLTVSLEHRDHLDALFSHAVDDAMARTKTWRKSS
jgi:hypothetical protein